MIKDFLLKKYDQYLGDHLSIKIKFFYIVVFGGMIASIPATITSFISKAGTAGILASLACFLFFVLILISARLTKKYDAIIFAAIYGLNFIIFPALYFTTGGVQSGMPSYFILGIIFTVLMMKGKTMFITLILELIGYSYLFYFGFNHPEYIATLSQSASHRDIALDFLIVSLCLAALVKVLSVLYENEQRHTNELLSKLEDLSIKDPLTGVYNRRFLLKYLESGISLNLQNNTPVSIIIFDLDRFKRLNDNYGHLVGDDVLRNLCTIFEQNCRNYDIVARYGGEEFMIVLPGAGEETAYRRAEQIRKRVEKTNFCPAVSEPITISGGVACFKKTMRTTEEFISVADQYLYLAKENGRNRVVWSKTRIDT